MSPDSYKSWQSSPIHFSSVKVRSDRSLIAASPGRGLYHKTEDGEWSGLSNGLPEGSTINRLQLIGGKPYACTSRGLYGLANGQWLSTEVDSACYQYKEEWGYGFAATENGLIYNDGKKWKKSAFEGSTVYDFLFSPQYLYVGLDQGISMYDRLTDRWAGFELGFGVTSIAASKEYLVGASERGELIVSNGSGGFDTIQFGDIFVFGVVSKHPNVYVCTDRGLYRIGRLGKQFTLFSVKPGVPVTDIDWHGSELYMATLSKGIQTMRTESGCSSNENNS
ncbi:hypothetical protein K0T92_07095 [Paenibacillus oenotherae]|uniref:Uncharacterized protein n=1 Tax=Paenibacillus oenotherae TaxID=1435645 RepID=A0ABS7D4L8_9BACL|nr:hypothetical protein [Paenibacillus oenotherae]MBW7474507.1 hypothetical protein [Paenibacillus oenotherae]